MSGDCFSHFLSATPSRCPRRVLPVELWAEVFSFCLPDDQFVTPNSTIAPLLLGRVCREWRSIASNTPGLWNSIALKPKLNAELSTWTVGFETWVQRSRTYLLSIAMSFSRDHNVLLRGIMGQLVASTHKWRHLQLDVQHDELGFILSAPMPSLQSIKLDCFNPLQTITLPPSHFPNLHAISFDDPVCIDNRYIIPWAQMKYISSIGLANTETHLHRLRASPHIESYDMTLFFADTPARAEPVGLESLKRLRIVAWVPNAVSVMLDNLILPLLSELTIEVPQSVCPCEAPAFPVDALKSLVERSGCSLLSLNVKNLRLDAIPRLEETIPPLRISIA